jgi:hypothetical protein
MIVFTEYVNPFGYLKTTIGGLCKKRACRQT